ncbi:MAG: POTRA domain-containing protein [Bacteroidota bacterium]
MMILGLYGIRIPERTLRDTFFSRALRLLYLLGLFFLPMQYAFSQDSSAVHRDTLSGFDAPLTLDSVIISGNEHTKDMVILREMSLKPGMQMTPEYLQYDQARIYSVGLFTQVEMRVNPTTPGKGNLEVHVRERWYIIPFPVFGIKEGDWHKAFYGAGLLHNNFRGRDEKLYVIGAVGYDPWGSISYRNPFLDDLGSYNYDGRLGYSRISNKSQQFAAYPNFDENHFAFSNTVGKRFNNYNIASLSAEYDVVGMSESVPNATISSSGTDRFFVFGAGYTFDTRDLAEFPGSGVFTRTSITKYGLPGKELDNVRYALDIRGFVPLTEGFVSASRFYTNVMAGSRSPSYNHVYFGYEYRIRGHYGQTTEGENIMGTSTEVRYALFAPRYYKVDFLPEQFGVWRFAIALALFADAGEAWFRGQPLAINSFEGGYGAGIDFLLPYSLVVRTEYAINEVHRGQFIVDLGAAF